MDLTNTLTYFGSVDDNVVSSEFTKDQRADFIVRKEILWESETATDGEVRKKEIEMIKEYQSNNPMVGYNKTPKYKLDR